MYCHKCGNKLDDEDIFCSKCGVKVKRPNESVPVEEPEEQQAEDVPVNEAPEEAVPEMVESEANSIQEETVAPEEEQQAIETENTSQTVNPEPAEEKTDATSDNIRIEFRPKEFTEHDFTTTQSSIFQPIPDIVIADATENPVKQKNSPKIVQAVCSVLLSVFVFAFAFVLVLQLFIRFGFTEEKLQEAFNNVNYKEVKVSGILNLESISEKYGKEIPEDATLAEVIYNMIDQRELVNPISQSEVEKLIERVDFQDFIAKKSSKAISILRSGSKEQPVNADEIIAFLKENEEEIERTIGIQLLDVDYNYMQQYLEDHNDELLDVFSEKNLTGTENSFGYTLIRFCCSDVFIAVLCVLIIGIAVAIGYINKKFYSSMLYTGVPIAIAGILLLVFGVFYDYLLSGVSSYVPVDLIKQFAAPVIDVLSIVSGIAVAIGAALIIIGIILKVKKAPNRRRPLSAV